MTRIVIAGASLAGITAASRLRREGFPGEIILLAGEEPLPYQRPPLSKDVLSGEADPRSCEIPFDAHAFSLLPKSANGLDLGERTLSADDEVLGWDALIIATGARARRLAPAGMDGEHVIRSVGDAQALRARLRPGARLVILGAGFLGMEAASTARKLGVDVTIVTQLPPMHGLGPFLASLLTDAATAAGVEIIVSPGGARYVGTRTIEAVEDDEGRQYRGDLYLTAAGCMPNVEWLDGSGLDARAGVPIDAHSRVLPAVWAAGDVTSSSGRRQPFWTNAVAQAEAAAINLAHPGAAADWTSRLRWFWTDQFGISLKLLGNPSQGVPELIQGDLATGRAVLRWEAGGRVVSAASLNMRIPPERLAALTGFRTTIEAEH